MTLDHLGAYGFSVPVLGKHYSIFRVFGRIAAPLFLFTLTESVKKQAAKESCCYGCILQQYW